MADLIFRECTLWHRYYLAQIVTNIDTDLYLMGLFWILLFKLRVPLIKWVPKIPFLSCLLLLKISRKLLLLCLFSLGIFVVRCLTSPAAPLYNIYTETVDYCGNPK
jgi:hypothetical protein